MDFECSFKRLVADGPLEVCFLQKTSFYILGIRQLLVFFVVYAKYRLSLVCKKVSSYLIDSYGSTKLHNSVT